jgi:hypothetical protein
MRREDGMSLRVRMRLARMPADGRFEDKCAAESQQIRGNLRIYLHCEKNVESQDVA